MESIKSTVANAFLQATNVAGLAVEAIQPQHSAMQEDGFAKSDNFGTNTQRGSVVGIEARMNPLPEFEHQVKRMTSYTYPDGCMTGAV